MKEKCDGPPCRIGRAADEMREHGVDLKAAMNVAIRRITAAYGIDAEVVHIDAYEVEEGTVH